MSSKTSEGPGSKILEALTKSRTDMSGGNVPLWTEKKHNTSMAESFSEDLKQYNCSHCSNGSCTACKLRRGMETKEVVVHDESSVITDEQMAWLEAQVKGGPGSGFFAADGHVGIPGHHGGSRDATPGEDAPAPKTPSLRAAAAGRVQFHKNRLAREIISHAARVKQIDEKPFRGVKDRLEARRHMKAIRQKTKELKIPEDQVWEVIDQFPVQEQAMIATMARLEKKDSKAAKVAGNVAKHLLKQKIQDLGSKYAPSPLLEPEQVKKLSIQETAAYLAAYDDPGRAVQFLDALKTADFEKAQQLRARGMQNVISNTQRNLRNAEWLDAAGQLHAELRRKQAKNPGMRGPTQREFEKLVSEAVRERSAERLRAHRVERGEPTIRFGGFGDKE